MKNKIPSRAILDLMNLSRYECGRSGFEPPWLRMEYGNRHVPRDAQRALGEFVFLRDG